ncbi:hypothetical protein ACHHYP_00835 [Achlya hypogyna]|uniref:Uncharacterized protein n=1 Tax=Achlya hypogyna TaxID=1202772 RepID=A0A1V9ZAK5_ACHHY|nr:hypothetical protein ACHHYP_00835 [Achlya hypogyna]
MYTSDEQQSQSQTMYQPVNQEEIIVPLPALLHSRYSKMLMGMTGTSNTVHQTTTSTPHRPVLPPSRSDQLVNYDAEMPALKDAKAEAEREKHDRDKLDAEKKERRRVKELVRLQAEADKNARRTAKLKQKEEKQAKKEAHAEVVRLQLLVEAEAKLKRRQEKEQAKLELQKKTEADAMALLAAKVARRQEKRRVALEHERHLLIMEQRINSLDTIHAKDKGQIAKLEAQVKLMTKMIKQAVEEVQIIVHL